MDVQGEPLTPDTVCMYDIVRYVIKPATRTWKCSYAELVSEAPQQPSWVVLHWWGMPLREMLQSLEQHSRDRGVSDECASYWIAAMATNQHARDAYTYESGTTPIHSAVADAMTLSFGTLALVDKRALFFRRVAPLYEVFLALHGTCTPHAGGMHAAIRGHNAHGHGAQPAHKFDVFTVRTHVAPHKPHTVAHALGLTDGFSMADLRKHEINKVARECSFPLELIEAALSATLSAAHASNERDKRTVIASLSAALHDEDTPVLVAERAIRGRFAVAALRCTLDSGGSKQPLFGRCLEALELSGLTDVSINLTSCEAFSSKAAERLSSSLPPTLESCALYFHDLPTEVADDLVKAFSHGLINRLKRMRRVSLFSNSLEEDGGYALGKALQNACSPFLESVDFGSPVPFSHPRVSEAITRPMVKLHPPISLYGPRRLAGRSLSFASQGLTCTDVILIAASASRGVPPRLEALDLSHNDIENTGVSALVKVISSGLLPHLRTVDLSALPNATNRNEVLEALKLYSFKRVEILRNECQAQGRKVPPHLLAPVRFNLEPGYDFRVSAKGMPAEPDEDDDSD